MSECAARFDLSADERKLLELAQEITAPYAAHQGALPLATLQQIFRKLEPSGYLGSILPVAAGGKGLSPLAAAARQSECAALSVRFRFPGAMRALPARIAVR
jgi:alkylation response protein AidB-like acyl-CoA dehydrogenase